MEAAMPPAQGISREKYWGEKTDAERVQLLGEIVENLSRVVIEHAQQLDLLRLHTHSSDGSLVAKLDAVAPREPRYDSLRGYRAQDANPLRRERR